jgi:enterochelin esterase-like enzyme
VRLLPTFFLLGFAACSSTPDAVPTPDGGPDAAEDAPVVATDGAPDAAPDAASPTCTRAAQAKTAGASLFDALVTDLAKLPDGSKSARVDAFLVDVKSQGGTPLEGTGDRLVFLARGAGPEGPWNVAGAFTDWKNGKLPMALVPGTDLYVLDTQVARGKAQAYKLLSGAQDSGFREDLLAENVEWDGFDKKTVGAFNAVAHPGDADMSKGRIVRHHDVHATKLADDRDVFVYLPPAYDDGSCKKLPHLVFHDGNESLTRVSFAYVADATYTKTPSASAVLAFVALPTQNVRTDEYTFGTTGAIGDAYGEFLLSDLEPILGKRYRLCGAASAKGLAGASLGGLISTYLAFQHPEAWGFIGAQSASYFWDNDWMLTRAAQAPNVPVRVYLDTGCPDDNCDVVRPMNDTLTKRAYDVLYVEEANAAHDWSFWAGRLPKLLTRFREGQTTCD